MADLTEGFCPRCYDFHPVRLGTDDESGIDTASCLKCGFTVDAGSFPHDPAQAERRYPDLA
jgi:Zn ribbon nucleic-acid-binding protein